MLSAADGGMNGRLKKLPDSNFFNQEFVPKRHKFHDAERNLISRSPAQRKTLRNGGKYERARKKI